MENGFTEEKANVSVSLWSIIHSYARPAINQQFALLKFPSPYGVSFILMLFAIPVIIIVAITAFPSPYGVSFILIKEKSECMKELERIKFPSPYGVSFILIG